MIFAEDVEDHYLELQADFERYLSETGLQVYLACKELVDADFFTISNLEYGHRWTDTYKNRFLARLYRLQEWYWVNPGSVTFLTLTTKQCDFVFIEDQINFIRDSWEKLLKAFRKVRPGLDYFTVMDFHRTGYGHYHIILFSDFDVLEQKRIRDLWVHKYNAGHPLYSVDFEVNMRDDINFLVAYIMKHGSKVLHSSLGVPGFLRFHSVIYYMQHARDQRGEKRYRGVRLFSMSRRISRALKYRVEIESKAVAVKRVSEWSSDLVYQDIRADVFDHDDMPLYRWEVKNNRRKVDAAVDFFCSLDFEVER